MEVVIPTSRPKFKKLSQQKMDRMLREQFDNDCDAIEREREMIEILNARECEIEKKEKWLDEWMMKMEESNAEKVSAINEKEKVVNKLYDELMMEKKCLKETKDSIVAKEKLVDAKAASDAKKMEEIDERE